MRSLLLLLPVPSYSSPPQPTHRSPRLQLIVLPLFPRPSKSFSVSFPLSCPPLARCPGARSTSSSSPRFFSHLKRFVSQSSPRIYSMATHGPINGVKVSRASSSLPFHCLKHPLTTFCHLYRIFNLLFSPPSPPLSDPRSVLSFLIARNRYMFHPSRRSSH